MSRRRHPSDRTPSRVLAAWAGLWALLLQIMVPLGQAVPVVGADGLPRTLVICSATQPRAIPGPAAEAPAPGAERAACAVCLAYAAGAGTDLPAAVVPPRPPATTAALTLPLADAVHGGMVPGLPRPRAPPALA